MTTPQLYQHAESVEQILIAYLSPQRRTAVARLVDDPLPFTIVHHITGIEDPQVGTADPVVSVQVLSDKALGWDLAEANAQQTHDALLYLARNLDTGPTSGYGSIDYIKVVEAPIWVEYEDTQILRKVGRYRIGLSYVPAV